MTTTKPQTSCALCGEPCPDPSARWWPSEYGEICQDCWEAMDEPITQSDVEALRQEISLLLPEEFDIPANPFDLGNDFDHLGVECAEEPRN
jgi:recombinational DNA repair protein (RecF pathway)